MFPRRGYQQISISSVITNEDWLAFTHSGVQLTFQGKLLFENGGAPQAQDNFAFCKVHNFTKELYGLPVVIVTVNHLYDSKNVYSIKPENNVLNTWIELNQTSLLQFLISYRITAIKVFSTVTANHPIDVSLQQGITISSFRVCVKDLAGMESQHDPVTVDYAVVGDLDPCINVSCNYFAVCKAFGPKDARCICVDNCPSYDEPVCSSNGTTYDNECIFQREMCRLKANFTLYHPDDCTDVCEPGWSFYNGSCYYTSDTCKTWSKASRICRGMGANLPAIESQEENVYIQHRHNGEKAWIGLNDIATEGLFTWVDGCPDKFRYWAESQPNDFRGEDCVHSLLPSHGYMWNDVDCSTCHQYTCKKGSEIFCYVHILAAHFPSPINEICNRDG
ncbi:Versican core protein [Stylophora pistillata]|uniref:Versican core protein n=1 Tax=Stylophora pistillata TaxID=50429 RepID=A0A2B4R6I6_STYPI|nr:Versican core protein [Stylophora pistillata]